MGFPRKLLARVGVKPPDELKMVGAHRGLPGLAPESTAPAYLAAARALRAAASHRPCVRDVVKLEGDVQLSKDGALFFHHDARLGRVTDAATVFPGRRGWPIEHFDGRELKRLDAGSWFNQARPQKAQPHFRGARLLTASEYFECVEAADDPSLGNAGRTGAVIELKRPNQHPGLEQKLVEALRARGWIDKRGWPTRPLTVQSYSGASLGRMKLLAPHVSRVLLTKGGRFRSGLELAKDARAVAISPPAGTLHPVRVLRAHKAGLDVYAHTVDRAWQIRALAAMGVDGIYTNRLDRWLNLAKLPSPDPASLVAQP